MSTNIETKIQQCIQYKKNYYQDIIQYSLQSDDNLMIVFNCMSEQFLQIKQNPQQLPNFYNLLVELYQNIPIESFKIFIRTDCFSNLREHIFYHYFEKKPLLSIEKQSILKLSDGFIGVQEYNELLSLIIDTEVIGSTPEDNFIEQLENIYYLKNQYEQKPSDKLIEQMKQNFIELENHECLNTIQEQDDNNLYRYLNIKDYIEKLDQNVSQGQSLDKLKEEVKAYLVQLQKEVDQLKKNNQFKQMKFSEFIKDPKFKKDITLFSYFRSSSSWRVRTILNLKNIDYDLITVHLLKNEQLSKEYKQYNPTGYIPTLVYKDKYYTESLAISFLLEDLFPKTQTLIPSDPIKKYKVLQICETINSGIQPLQNLSVIRKIEQDYNGDKLEFARFYNLRGFKLLEQMVEETMGKYCIGDELTLADVFLLPQFRGSSMRFKIDQSEFPNLQKICQNLDKLEEFKKAYPENQPDSN